MENQSIISHVSVGTNDFAKAKAFYTELLASVGINVVEDLTEFEAVGFGKAFPEFWIGLPENKEAATAGNGTHVSFLVDSNEHVDVFYKKAMELGAKDGGAPGPRVHYGAGYYGAFIFDADRNKLEAMHWTEGA